MTPRLSGHFSIFGLVFFVLKSLLGIATQWSRDKFAISTLKPRSHDKIGHFTVMYGSEAEGDLVWIQTFLLYYVNQVILMLTSIFQEQFP